MAMFKFNKKKEELKKEELPTEAPSPELEGDSDNLAELPEFPTMPDEGIDPLPKIEPLEDLNKNEISIPSMNERPIIRPSFKKSEIPPEEDDVGILDKETHDKIKDFSDFVSSFEQEKEVKQQERKIKKERVIDLDRETFEEEEKDGPVFVNVKKYTGIVNYIEISGIARNFELSVVELEKIRQKDNSELEILKKSLEGFQKRIMVVDDIISKG
ncbi:MAG: hypothetical protein PHV16_04065 [Candidatus Nanoarchaeia archaeon]|nr:hypothetical protein [Candidatus Nanoarchaeia archaeon]